jgi:CelD/BcsL family acetyltransferase involved in cellulose biosynthesis
VFHTTGWLEALQRTYGYEPVALTTSPPGSNLENAIAFCRVRSWVTGRRLVSLPFSDHCDPLAGTEDLATLTEALLVEQRERGWRYIELRPSRATPPQAGFGESDTFFLHLLDLRPGPEALLAAFHKDSVQRKIRRAEREGLNCEEGRSEELLRRFYRLLVMTRRRHQLPPQPFDWFRNLTACCRESLNVRIASHRDRPVAGMITLQHRHTVVYKYGASDAAFHALGGMHLLFWKAITAACAAGHVTFDFGRSDPDQSGLLTFKDRWGATRLPVSYWRCPASRTAAGPLRKWIDSCASRAFFHAPDGIRVAAGTLLYKHIG